jgi:hypothetical protein
MLPMRWHNTREKNQISSFAIHFVKERNLILKKVWTLEKTQASSIAAVSPQKAMMHYNNEGNEDTPQQRQS